MPQNKSIAVPHGALVVICDGAKAILAENSGSPYEPRLSVRETIDAPENPPTREQGTDRPGRVHQSVGSRRSAVEAPDFQAAAEASFLADLARRLAVEAREAKPAPLVIVAPARALAILRETLDAQTRALIAGEIVKDLTNHPVPEIEKLLAK